MTDKRILMYFIDVLFVFIDESMFLYSRSYQDNPKSFYHAQNDL
jgi:hypothetical protein